MSKKSCSFLNRGCYVKMDKTSLTYSSILGVLGQGASLAGARRHGSKLACSSPPSSPASSSKCIMEVYTRKWDLQEQQCARNAGLARLWLVCKQTDRLIHRRGHRYKDSKGPSQHASATDALLLLKKTPFLWAHTIRQ